MVTLRFLVGAVGERNSSPPVLASRPVDRKNSIRVRFSCLLSFQWMSFYNEHHLPAFNPKCSGY